MLSRFSLLGKMMMVSGILSLIAGIVGLAGAYYLKHVAQPYRQIANVELHNYNYIGDMLAEIRTARIRIRSLVIPRLTPEDGKKAIADLEAAIAETDKAADGIKKLPFAPGEEELWKEVESAWINQKRAMLDAEKLYQSADPRDKERLLEFILHQEPAAAAPQKEAFGKFNEFHDKLSDSERQEAESSYHNGLYALTIIVALGTLCAFGIGFLFARSISNAFSKISDDLFQSANEVSSASQQISSASQQLATGASEAASSLEETVASLEELSSIVKQNSVHAQSASKLSQESQDSAVSGETELRNLVVAVNEISTSSKKIEDIINVIDDIAFQTNLLALNAAVEAARAGEQGKGFAVVAEAVRTLAQRSSSAAKDITVLIKESVQSAEHGSQVASESGAVLNKIVTSVQKVASLNTEISAGSQEQSAGLGQISQAMNQLDQATQGNAASAEEVAATSEEMAAQAASLHQLVLELKTFVSGKKVQHSRAPAAAPNKKSSVVSFAKKSFPLTEDQSESHLKVGTTDGF